jgi:hypothetical protein
MGSERYRSRASIVAHITAWLAALDAVDLRGMGDLAHENHRVTKLRPAIATMLYLHFRQVFA